MTLNQSIDEKLTKLLKLCEGQKEFSEMEIVKKIREKYRQEEKISKEEMESLNKLFKEYHIGTKDFDRLYSSDGD